MGKTCTELFAGIDCTILGNADDEVNGIASVSYTHLTLPTNREV